MINFYQKKHYREYRVLLSDGTDRVVTRDECFAVDDAECEYKQRWYYSPDQELCIRLPRNEEGERLYRANVADLKQHERDEERAEDRYINYDDVFEYTEDTEAMDALLANALHRESQRLIQQAIAELSEEDKKICLGVLSGLSYTEIGRRVGKAESTVRFRIQKMRTVFADFGLKDFL